MSVSETCVSRSGVGIQLYTERDPAGERRHPRIPTHVHWPTSHAALLD